MEIFVKSPNPARITKTVRGLLLLFFAAASLSGLAQSPQTPQPIRSPEVHSDHRVTFRFRAPNAKEVLLAREGAQRLPMQKDEQGVWSVTTDPLEPDLYGYSFVADGVSLIDPSNSLMKPNLLSTQSVVHVPGPASLPWEINHVPHGTIHHHFYQSGVVGDERDFTSTRRPATIPMPRSSIRSFTSCTVSAMMRADGPQWGALTSSSTT